jgi:hypothetical protein
MGKYRGGNTLTVIADWKKWFEFEHPNCIFHIIMFVASKCYVARRKSSQDHCWLRKQPWDLHDWYTEVWTNVGLIYRLHSDINPGINMSMKILDQSGMVCPSYYGWDHIPMACENWIPWLISDPTGNNILGTLIYIHTQLFMNIDAMAWVSTFLRCKVWVVNYKLCCSLAWWEVVTL